MLCTWSRTARGGGEDAFNDRTTRATLLDWLMLLRCPWLARPAITPTSLVGLGLGLDRKGYPRATLEASLKTGAKGGCGGMLGLACG